MTPEQMKQLALDHCLASEDKVRGNHTIYNAQKNSAIKCSCYQRTSFTFTLYQSPLGDTLTGGCEISEEGARCFLAGMGVL